MSESHERYDTENQSKRKNGRKPKLVGRELLATDCEKAWLHSGWEDTLQKWCDLTVRNEPKKMK